MDFNQESIHNADSWLGYRGLRSIQPNKGASIRASPRVAAGSIIGQHEPPLDNEQADAPLLPSLLEKDLLFTSDEMSASFHHFVPRTASLSSRSSSPITEFYVTLLPDETFEKFEIRSIGCSSGMNFFNRQKSTGVKVGFL